MLVLTRRFLLYLSPLLFLFSSQKPPYCRSQAKKCIHQWRAVSKHSVPLHANFCFLRNSAIGWKSEKLAPHYHDGDDDDDDYYYYYINYLLRLDSVWIKMDQLTFCPLIYTPFVLQIWFFGDFVWFHWSYHPNVLQFYRVSQTFEAFAVSFV